MTHRETFMICKMQTKIKQLEKRCMGKTSAKWKEKGRLAAEVD